MAHVYEMGHDEVSVRLTETGVDKPGYTVHGVPRGGACAVQYLRKARAVAVPGQADVILDDIIDSGKTRDRYRVRYPSKRFVALVDKTEGDCEIGWVKFPWEGESSPEDAVVRLLEYIGEDPTRDGLADTPDRVIRSFEEMTSGYSEDPKEILGKVFAQDHDEMIISAGIRFSSLCEHHMLPFSGTAAVGYIPWNGKVVGLSKLARVVGAFSHRLQIQERLTQQVASSISKALNPLGVGVVMRAHHSCMGCRGVRQPDSEMVTSCMTGVFRDKAEVRAEFLGLVG